jgi:hypothetical protein
MHTRQNPGTNNIKFVLYNGSVLCDAVERYCRLTVLQYQEEYGGRRGGGGRKNDNQMGRKKPKGKTRGKTRKTEGRNKTNKMNPISGKYK